MNIFVAFLAMLVPAQVDSVQEAPWETTPKPVELPHAVPVEVLPRLTPRQHAEDLATEATRASSLAAASEQIAREHLRAAKAGRRAYQHELAALKGQIAVSKIGTGILKKVEKVQKLRAKTMEAVRHTGRLVDEIPKLIDRGVQRAVDDTIADALKELDKEKADVTKTAQAIATKQAAAAMPTAGQAPSLSKAGVSSSDSYSDAAQKLAKRVNAMKQRAMELGKQAVQWQQQAGDMGKAQQLMLEAHQLMNKAMDLGGEAQLYGNVANLVSQEQGTLQKLQENSQLGGLPDVVPAKVPEAPC